MSKKANPTSIGLFVVIGVALFVMGLLLFSSSKLFTRRVRCVLYFHGSLNGLNQGAPVKYRGVTIGSVAKVMIHWNEATNDYAMPVIIDIQENLLQERLQETHLFDDRTSFETAVSRGLRGTLEAESFVTGVLYVGLEFVPDAPPPVFHQLTPTYVEIPTRPTEIQQLMENLAHIDFKGLEEHLTSLLAKLDTAIGALNVGAMSGGITNLLASLNRVATSPEITNTLGSIQRTMGEYRLLAEKLSNRVDPLASGITNTLAEANQTLAQLRGSVQQISAFVGPDSPLQSDLSQALQQLAGASQSVASLAEFLKRHPNSLITGRQPAIKTP
jgi:phospholipid/cholesterol/gamma-HCH transport system substrate-binding protein